MCKSMRLVASTSVVVILASASLADQDLGRGRYLGERRGGRVLFGTLATKQFIEQLAQGVPGRDCLAVVLGNPGLPGPETE